MQPTPFQLANALHPLTLINVYLDFDGVMHEKHVSSLLMFPGYPGKRLTRDFFSRESLLLAALHNCGVALVITSGWGRLGMYDWAVQQGGVSREFQDRLHHRPHVPLDVCDHRLLEIERHDPHAMCDARFVIVDDDQRFYPDEMIAYDYRLSKESNRDLRSHWESGPPDWNKCLVLTNPETGLDMNAAFALRLLVKRRASLFIDSVDASDYCAKGMTPSSDFYPLHFALERMAPAMEAAIEGVHRSREKPRRLAIAI